jgi:hypothetical protein
VVDSLAKLSVSQAKGRGLKKLVGPSSTKLLESLNIKSPVYYSSKMSKDSSPTTEVEPSKLFWKSWGVSVTDSSGKCSILSGSVSPKTVSGPSLLDILEPNPAEKYFLSQKLVDSLVAHKAKHKAKGNGFGMQIRTVQEPYQPDTPKTEQKTSSKSEPSQEPHPSQDESTPPKE